MSHPQNPQQRDYLIFALNVEVEVLHMKKAAASVMVAVTPNAKLANSK